MRAYCAADKLGTGMMIVRSDIGGNINRLATAHARDPARYTDIFQILLDEVARREQCGTRSETNALLWLKRCVGVCPEFSEFPCIAMVIMVCLNF